ncbi:MAG TPA: MarR family winged helix-turn-helix transcriptional regulator [Magnetospirillaceae bacterium]|jgi:DNA-binding MarR family transcriptional regulator
MKAAKTTRSTKRPRKSKPSGTFPHPSIDHWLDPGDGGKRLEVKDFLSMRFANLGALFHRKVTKHYLAPYGIGLPEWRTMTILAQHAPISTRALRDISEMDKGQMSRALDILAERGLIQRNSDATHMVRQVISITEAGHVLYRKIMPEARRSQALLLESMTTTERKALHSALIKLRAVVDDIPED